jgi:hypothetical protein
LREATLAAAPAFKPTSKRLPRLAFTGLSAIAAITVQNTLGVEAVAPLSADLVTSQIEAIAGDFSIEATKTGMLATAAIVEAVAAAIAELDLPLVVVDPVLVSYERRAAARCGWRAGDDHRAAPARARRHAERPGSRSIERPPHLISGGCARCGAGIRDMGRRAVIITGGHVPGSGFRVPGSGGRLKRADDDVVDLLFDGHEFHEFRARESTVSTRTAPVHVRIGRRGRPRSRPHPCRRRAAARSSTSAARSRTRQASGTAAVRSITSGVEITVR